MEDAPIDRAAAESIHYVDPRVRQLAAARWQLKTGGTYTDWLMLGKDNPEALISDGKDWMRAAVATGLLQPLQDPEKPTCTWCGQGPDSHRVLVLGPGANICGNCIELVKIVRDESQNEGTAPNRQSGTGRYCEVCEKIEYEPCPDAFYRSAP